MPGEPPEASRNTYLTEMVDDITVYYPPGLVLMSSALSIGLRGFWFLKWLRLDGVAPVAACAV